jgi:Uma2 family endonuclease
MTRDVAHAHAVGDNGARKDSPMGTIDARRPRVTLEQFHAFRDERPKEEKWELIDGVMTMMPPPARTHQRISKNLMRMLDAQMARAGLAWEADMEIGVLVPDDDRYNPEPDVTVVDRDYPEGQVYAERFYFVAEVLSPGDKSLILDLKRDYYQRHDHCRGVLFVKQDAISARLHVRAADGWREAVLGPGDRIVIPDIGDIGMLGELYRSTPLQPAP